MTTGAYLPVVINPGYNGATASGEIVYVTNVTTSGAVDTITISGGRGREGTTPGSGPTGTQWVSGPLASDFGLANQIKNGEFPEPVAGQVFLSTSTSGGAWSNGNAGQILVTSGTTVTWRTPQAWMNYNGVEVGNALKGGSATVSVTVSGYSTYLVTARTTVYGKTGTTGCDIRFMVADSTTGSPPSPISTNATYDISWGATTGGETSGAEYSISATYQPGTTASKTIYFIVSPITNPGVGLYSRRGQMNVVGIA